MPKTKLKKTLKPNYKLLVSIFAGLYILSGYGLMNDPNFDMEIYLETVTIADIIGRIIGLVIFAYIIERIYSLIKKRKNRVKKKK